MANNNNAELEKYDSLSLGISLIVGISITIALCMFMDEFSWLYVFMGFCALVFAFNICRVIFRNLQAKKEEKYINDNKAELNKLKSDFEHTAEELEEQFHLYKKEFYEKEEKYKPFYSFEGDQKVGICNNNLVIYECDKPRKYFADDVEYGSTKIKKIIRNNYRGKITEKETIPISSIVYYTKDGDVKYTTRTESSGNNIKGAIVGGVIAGQAGAVIGSRGKTSTYTDKHDSRCTIIKTENDEKRYPISLYDGLVKIIPDKELTYIQVNGIRNRNASNKSSSIDLLREYKALLDEGIITKQEFETKKKELL